MLTNAWLTRIDAAPTPGPGGDRVWVSGGTLAVRVAVAAPTRRQLQLLDQRAADATAVCYLDKASAGGNVPAAGGRLVVDLDGVASSRTYLVLVVIDQQKAGGLAHWECFLKEL